VECNKPDENQKPTRDLLAVLSEFLLHEFYIIWFHMAFKAAVIIPSSLPASVVRGFEEVPGAGSSDDHLVILGEVIDLLVASRLGFAF